MVIQEKAEPTPEVAPESAPPATDTVEKMRLIADRLYEKKAEHIIGLDVKGLSGIAEGLVIVSAGSARHARSLADDLVFSAKRNKFDKFGVEGYQSGTWILVDLNDVVIHIFQNEARSFYNLEGLWSEAPIVGLHLPDEKKESALDDFISDADDFNEDDQP